MAQAGLTLLLELKNKLKAGLSSAKDTVLGQMKDLKSKLDSFSANNMEAFAAIKNEIPGVGRALGLLSNPYALAAGAALAFGVVTKQAIGEALDWERTMAKVNVTAGLGKTELAALSDKLLEIGSRGSGELQQVPEAFNRIISAGLTVNQSLEALEPTLKAAKAGFTDIETVATAGIGVMKASGENINVVYDTLFATLNKGNAEFADIARYLPKIIPGARLAGAALGETAGAFAFLTAQGFNAEQASTGMLNSLKALSDPKYIDGFKKIGVNVFNSKGEFRGIVPIVDDLKNSLKGLTTEQQSYKLDLVGLDMEAKGAFGSMIQNVSGLKEIIDFTTNSTGQLNEAVKNSATSTDSWKEGINKFKVLFIEFGQFFLPILQVGGELFNSMAQGIMDGITGLKEFINQSVFLRDLFNGIGTVVNFTFTMIGKLFGGIWDIIKSIGGAFVDTIKPIFQLIEKAYILAKAVFEGLTGKESFQIGFDKSIKESLAKKPDSIVPSAATSNTPSAAATGVSSFTSGGASSSPSGSQSKSIVINIEALHKGDNMISTEGGNMTLSEFEKMMNELALRLIRNVEASY